MMVTHLVWIHSSQPWSEMVSLHQEMHLQPHGAETGKHFCYQCLSTTCWSSDPVSCQYQQDPLSNVPAGPFIQNSMVSHNSSRATKPKPPTQQDQNLLQTSCHYLPLHVGSPLQSSLQRRRLVVLGISQPPSWYILRMFFPCSPTSAKCTQDDVTCFLVITNVTFSYHHSP